MASLEGSFFTGLDTGGGGGGSTPIPANEVVFGSGPSITSDPTLTYVVDDGLKIDDIGMVSQSGQIGYFLIPTDAGNNPMAFVATDSDNAGSARNDFIARLGYNTRLLASDHAFYMAFESYFNPATAGLTEWYLEYFSTDHMTSF